MWSRFVFASDLHGDMQDPSAVKAFLKFCELWKPHLKIFGGDCFDFRCLRNGASEEEKRESLQQDFADGTEFLNQYRPDVFLYGNHSARGTRLAESDKGIVSDYARKMMQDIEDTLGKFKCRTYPYDKRKGVYRLGKLNMVHGYACGVGSARKHALVYGDVLYGHTHQIQRVTVESHNQATAYNVGCLCKLDLDYNAAQIGTLAQAHGWVYGVSDSKTGDFHVWQAERVGGKFKVATEVIDL